MHLLVMKYRDPDRPGLLNYLNLHHDIVAIGQQAAKDKELIVAPQTDVDRTFVAVREVLFVIESVQIFMQVML